jgi:hypothetical protein
MISLLRTGILTISVSQREDYLFEKCRICTDFIDVLLKDGINGQSGERRLFKDIFACSFGLETFNLFVKTTGSAGRSIEPINQPLSPAALIGLTICQSADLSADPSPD